MFRLLLGRLQALWENRSKSYLYFNAKSLHFSLRNIQKWY